MLRRERGLGRGRAEGMGSFLWGLAGVEPARCGGSFRRAIPARAASGGESPRGVAADGGSPAKKRLRSPERGTRRCPRAGCVRRGGIPRFRGVVPWCIALRLHRGVPDSGPAHRGKRPAARAGGGSDPHPPGGCRPRPAAAPDRRRALRDRVFRPPVVRLARRYGTWSRTSGGAPRTGPAGGGAPCRRPIFCPGRVRSGPDSRGWRWSFHALSARKGISPY